MTRWRVVLNSKLWNKEKYEKDFYTFPNVKYIPQSKGRCTMVSCPEKNDIVYFVYKKKIIMKGIVVSDGFITGSSHQTDTYNLGEVRSHSLVNLLG